MSSNSPRTLYLYLFSSIFAIRGALVWVPFRSVLWRAIGFDGGLQEVAGSLRVVVGSLLWCWFSLPMLLVMTSGCSYGWLQQRIMVGVMWWSGMVPCGTMMAAEVTEVLPGLVWFKGQWKFQLLVFVVAPLAKFGSIFRVPMMSGVFFWPGGVVQGG